MPFSVGGWCLLLLLMLMVCFINGSQEAKWSISSGPKITMLFPEELPGESIDVQSGSHIHLKCSGEKPLSWSFPENYGEYRTFDQVANMSIVENKCQMDIIYKCQTELIIYGVTYNLTGNYTCHYNDIMGRDHRDSIYIFVNDPENLVVPYEGMTDFQLLSVFQFHPATIPCRPTYSSAQVTLWKQSSNDQAQIKVNWTLGVTYDPRKGFHFKHPRWTNDMAVVQCRYWVPQVNGTATTVVSLHWAVLPVELQPLIDDSSARHIVLGDTFTLKCLVHLEIGVTVGIHWDYPNNQKNARHRIKVSEPKTTPELVNNQRYQTVSLEITVHNSSKQDEGLYRCKVTDGHSREFIVKKRMVIYDKQKPIQVSLTAKFNTSLPIVTNFGEQVQLNIEAQVFPDISFVELYWFRDEEQLQVNNSEHYQISLLSEDLDADNNNNNNSNNSSISTTISLIILSAKVTDSGIYTLKVIQPVHQQNVNISVPVYIRGGKPNLEIINYQDFYVLNQTYEISCKSYGYPTTQIYWSWMPCDAPHDCHADSLVNLTTLQSTDNLAQIITEYDHSRPYLNVSRLIIQTAQASGVFRCFATAMWSASQVTNAINEAEEEMAFIVMDAPELFWLASSIEEPIVNDTVLLTCKANLFRYEEVWWINSNGQNVTEDRINRNRNQYSISTSILLENVQLNHSTRYVCQALSRYNSSHVGQKEILVDVQEKSAPEIVETNLQDLIEVNQNSHQNDLRCYVKGRPRPFLEWYRNGEPLTPEDSGGLQFVDKGQRLLFPTRLLEQDSGVYECRAKNLAGQVSRRVWIQVKGHTNGIDLSLSEILFIILYLIMGTVIMVAAYYFGKKYHRQKQTKRELELLSHKLLHQSSQQQTMQMYNPEIPLHEQIDLLSYDRRFEFPKERLILGKTLGQGAFGRVVKAQAIGLENDEQVTTVAVKMLKEPADSSQLKALVAELKILIHLGRHLNIVNLLGAVTKNLVRGEFLVIVEYCQFGNLRHYLLANRNHFIDQLGEASHKIHSSICTGHQNGIMTAQSSLYQPVDSVRRSTNLLSNYYEGPNPNNDSGSISYADVMPVFRNHPEASGTNYMNTALAYYNNNYVGCSNAHHTSMFHKASAISHQEGRIVTTSDLICWAFQCARGMDYLTMRKLIHRDLAARNVLLASNNVVKICDFGLAKDICKYDNYVKKDDGPLPIKWMAIESIIDKIFTSKSDVWSYGILLWELFTLGQNPYPGIEIDGQFYQRLKQGYRMEKPEFASDQLYGLMQDCWQANPNDRPDFAEIAERVGQLLDDQTKRHYIELNNPYLQMNEEILGSTTNDYLKMNSATSIMGDETDQYETNICLLANTNQQANSTLPQYSAEERGSAIEMCLLQSNHKPNNNE